MKKAFLFISLVLAVTLVYATTNTWNIAGNGNWSTASNWSRGVVPTAKDDIVFANDANITVALDFTTSTTVNSISVGTGGANVTFATGSACIINLGGAGNTTTALTIKSGKILTLNATVNAAGIVLDIPSGSSAIIHGVINFSAFGTWDGIGTGQTNQLIGEDANTIQFTSTGSCNSNARQAINVFGATSINNHVVVFKSGAKFICYNGGSPFGTAAAPAAICKFEAGSTFLLYGGTGFGAATMSGRTYGNLILANGGNGFGINASNITTTILDTLVVIAGNFTLANSVSNTASPTFAINHIRVSTGNNVTFSPALTLGTNITTAAVPTSYTISGQVSVITGAGTSGNATLTLGAPTGTGNSTANIKFIGSGKVSTSQFGDGVPSIIMGNASTGKYTTNLTVANGATIALNANLNIVTINNITSLTVQPTGKLVVGKGYTITKNANINLQSDGTKAGILEGALN